jgi:glycosyltransferase involved in cell wall biosynthesis
MRVIVLHSFYQQHGGEESSLAADLSLLESLGIEHDLFSEHNSAACAMTAMQLVLTTFWSVETAQRLRRQLSLRTYDFAHVHNTFPVMSGAVYHVLKEFGLPVVQTLHNYRLVCANGLLFRDSHVCEDCVGRRVPLPMFYRGCYHRGIAASALVASQMLMHRSLGTYTNKIDTYLALTSFAREVFVRSGWERDHILLRPNFIDPDPGVGDGQGNFALFVGRLSEEKGIPILVDAWLRLGTKRKLRIIGDGPMRPFVEHVALQNANIEYLGFRTRDEVLQYLKRATFLVFPSIWYEGMPMTILESFAVGTPVLAFQLGGMSEMILDGRTGWLVGGRTAAALADTIETVHAGQSEAAPMRRACRNEYLEKYSVQSARTSLEAAYRHAAARSAERLGGRP